MASEGNDAIVIGGSMAGLLAARVLSDHLDHVTVIDRDRFPSKPEYRKGVPQSRHAHVLLARGQELLEQFFPGLVDELCRDGAVLLETPRDVLALTKYGWGTRYRPGLSLLSLSRELLEFHVRRRLAAAPAVEFIEETDVTDLVDGGGFVDGVRTRRRGTADAGAGGAAEIHARLIVDATGRDSHAPTWLRAMGYDAPPETKVVPFAGYASRYYAEPESFTADWKILFFFPSPDFPRGGVLFPIEGHRWLVTLIGVGGVYPPTDEEGFLAFARSLRSPMLHNVIRDASPLSDIYGYRRTENQLRSYDKLSRSPDGFLVLGDAACAFNPIYGQGMTVCALEALELERCLAERRAAAGFSGLGRRFQEGLARTNAVPWLLATGADLAYATTEGPPRGSLSHVIGAYMDRLQRVATRDPVVASAFRRVTQLLIRPSALFAPGIAIRVLAPRKIERRDHPPTETPFGAGKLGPVEAPPRTA